MKRLVVAVLLLSSLGLIIAGEGVPVVDPQKQYVHFLTVEGYGLLGPIMIPGSKLTGEIESGINIPLWSHAQAARLGAALAIRDLIYTTNEDGSRTNQLTKLFTGTVMKGEEPIQQESNNTTTHLCLLTSSLDRPIHFELPGKELRAVREDGVEVRIFSHEQAEFMYPTLLAEKLTIPEIAAVLSGFVVAPPRNFKLGQTEQDSIVFADCGTCTDGFLCTDPSTGCCGAGIIDCRSCTLCSSRLTMMLYP